MRAALALTLAFTLLSPLALADPARAPADRADALFEEGRSLLEQGQIAAACARLEQSFQLSPRLGTMLNLGGCFEKNGQLARAIAIYERAATMAHEAGRPERERAAREFAAAVEPRVAKLLLIVEEPCAGLVVEADGEVLSVQSGLVPLDVGRRVIRARAPGKAAWSTTVIAEAATTLRVSVPPLADEETPSLAAPEPLREVPPARSTLPTIGIAGGLAVLAAGVTVGTVFGLTAKAKHDDSNVHCDATGCDPDGISLISDAKSAANVSTVAFAVAGAGLVTAAAFWLFRSAPPATGRLSTSAAGVGVRF